jgi:hypothetical protein
VGEPPVKVLYVLGHARSGSTILGNLLGELEGAFHAGELRFLWSWGWQKGRLCGCGQPVPDCAFWNPVVTEALDGRPPERVLGAIRRVARLRHLRRLLRPGAARAWSDLREVGDTLGPLYRGIARTARSRLVIDSSKDPAYGAVVSTLPGIRPFYLHLVRDPRASAYSWQMPKPRSEGGDLMPRRTAMQGARAWVLENAAASLVAGGGRRALRLRYEDFVARPGAAVDRILSFIQEPPASIPWTDDGGVVLGPNHTVSGNPVRFRTGSIELTEDDRWRTGMRDGDRRAVTAVTLPLLLRYGYPLRPRAGGRVDLRPSRR